MSGAISRGQWQQREAAGVGGVLPGCGLASSGGAAVGSLAAGVSRSVLRLRVVELSFSPRQRDDTVTV